MDRVRSPVATAAYVRHWKRDGADVYVGRPSVFGNPFRLADESQRGAVLAAYRTWVAGCPDFRRHVRRVLAGKTLGCWCSPRLCHAQVLAEIANDPANSPADPVFVFGSNMAGRHGQGAALFAHEYRSAEYGTGEGRTGNSYAIPTKDANLRRLDLGCIHEAVFRFLAYAEAHPDLTFDVTRIGCGLAGHRDAEIFPLFEQAPANCRLPYLWQRELDGAAPLRAIVAGSRTFADPAVMAEKLDLYLGDIHDYQIVSGGAKGADQLGEQYAVDHHVPFLRVPAEWDRYGKRRAGSLRNQHMSFLASHLVAFWDGRSRGTYNMLETAYADGLEVRVVRTDRMAPSLQEHRRAA